eukprot:gene3001-3275_t
MGAKQSLPAWNCEICQSKDQHCLCSHQVDPEGHLKQHLIEIKGWRESRVEKAITAYAEFLTLLITSGDDLSPTDEIDEVWHAHILHTRDYEAFNTKYSPGKKLHHDPLRSLDQDARKFRAIRTVIAYESTFGHRRPKGKAWKYEFSENEPTPKHALPTDRERSVSIEVHMLSGHKWRLRVSLEDSVEDLKLLIFHFSDGTPPDSQLLMYAGKELEDDMTLGSYGIGDGSRVGLMLKLRGC